MVPNEGVPAVNLSESHDHTLCDQSLDDWENLFHQMFK